MNLTLLAKMIERRKVWADGEVFALLVEVQRTAYAQGWNDMVALMNELEDTLDEDGIPTHPLLAHPLFDNS